MKRTALFVALVALALGLAAQAQEKHEHHAGGGEAGSWKGEVVDLACYLGEGKKGEGHKGCAQMCASSGQPIGLLTADGKLFLIVGSHEGTGLDDAKKLAGCMVEVKGKMLERDGIRAIEVASVKEAKG